MLNPLRDFVAFDLETTGLERDVDEIIEIGAVRVRGGSIEARISWLVKAERALTPLVESLTGLSEEILADARDAAECLPEFLRFAEGLPLVAHNSDFDSAFLEHALAKAGLPALANPIYDSLLLARVAWPLFTSHRLESLVDKLGIPPQKAHRALPDAEQAALLWLKAEEKLAGYSPHTLATLGSILASGPSPWRQLFAGDADPSAVPDPATAGAAEAASPLPSLQPAGKPVTASAESLFATGKVEEAFAAMGRPYQARAKQARMASLAERAFKESRFLVAEAEPGTGRMLACLVAALLQAKSRKRPVFIAVAGRGRMERIVTSEVPLLKSLLGADVRVEPLKDPGNYLSPRKLAGILAHPETRLGREERLAMLPLITWLEDAGDGDIASNMGFNHERNKLLWSKLASDSYAAEPGSHAHAARARAQKAHLVLISQELFLDDLALDFSLLPRYEMILIDEAHRLPESGQARLGREVSFFRLKHILQTLALSKHDASGLLAEMERQEGIPAQAAANVPEAASAEGDAEAPESASPAAAPAEQEPKTDLERLRRMVFEPERQLQKFFNKIAKHASKRRKDGESRIRYADKLVVEFNAGPESVTASIAELERLLANLAGTRLDLAQDLRKTAEQLREFRSDLEHLAHPSGNGEVFWIEDFPNPHRALIRSAPLGIGAFLAEKFYPQMDAVIFASSAIALGEEFKFFCMQIGLETAFPERLKTALVRSKDPQDRPYPVLLARFSPVLSNNGALQSLGQIVIRGLLRFKKPSFLLFTHIGMLKQARALLQDGICREGRMVLAQHVDGSRDNLLHLFRHRQDACLLGTEAFLENLGDGDMLPEIVVVTKLPFPVPTEPLIAPHLEKLQEAGLNPLYDYLLPCSILRLKQELNRLPRRPGLRTALWILDPRLATEKYARYYQRGLGREAIYCDNEGELFSRTAAMMAGAVPVAGGTGGQAETEGAQAMAGTETAEIAETAEAAGLAGEPAA